jgi:hypothetical protein
MLQESISTLSRFSAADRSPITQLAATCGLAAVAAATAVYVVDLRAKGEQYDELSVHTRQLMTTVARRHSGIENQIDLDNWVERLELNDVGRILTRLRNVVDVLVQDNWWIDRDAIQSELPDQ